MGSKSKKADKAEKTDKTEVILLRLGVGKEGFHLSAGATLGDLLRAAELNSANQEIFIDGKSVEDALVLPPGAIISVGPRPKNGSPPRSWQETIGMVHRDGEFRKPADAAEKRREDEKDGS
jgi:hypothetical protein